MKAKRKLKLLQKAHAALQLDLARIKGASAYWPDPTDPLAQRHGRAKCEALARDVQALTFAAWSASASADDVTLALEHLGRTRPGFATDVHHAFATVDGNAKWINALVRAYQADGGSGATD